MAIRTRISALMLIVLLPGCASWPSWHLGSSAREGNYSDASQVVSAQLAADAFKRLADLYPPAQTTITFRSRTPDPFGQALAQNLRLAGFAVQQTISKDPLLSPVGGIALSYLVATMGTQEYRVTIDVDGTSFSRAYVNTPQGLASASFWTQRGDE